MNGRWLWRRLVRCARLAAQLRLPPGPPVPPAPGGWASARPGHLQLDYPYRPHPLRTPWDDPDYDVAADLRADLARLEQAGRLGGDPFDPDLWR